MGLVTIGGQSAYIIDSKPAEVGRTSTGVGYAQLVSQQRWKIWEQAEKQVLRQMEFEKMSYEAQLDAYAKQKAQLQKSLLKTQEVKDKIKNGDYTFSQGLAACQAGTPKRRRRN
jgi:translation initiation factor IF-3